MSTQANGRWEDCETLSCRYDTVIEFVCIKLWLGDRTQEAPCLTEELLAAIGYRRSWCPLQWCSHWQVAQCFSNCTLMIMQNPNGTQWVTKKDTKVGEDRGSKRGYERVMMVNIIIKTCYVHARNFKK